MQISFDRGRWSPNTREVYTYAWADWEAYCHERGVQAIPAAPQDIADFIWDRSAKMSISAISARRAAMVAAHKMLKASATSPEEKALYTLEMDHPLVADAWAEARRVKGTRGTPKEALLASDMRALVDIIPGHALQHRALMLLTFASAMRRSEVVAINVEDLKFTADDMTIAIRRSKTDKAGKGQVVAILRTGNDYCAVRALEAWMGFAQITSGPIFRYGDQRMDARTVADIAKRYAARIGRDPRGIGAHSMRRGCITSMFRNDAKLEEIMKHSRHKSPNIALGYIEEHVAVRNPAIKLIGL